MACMNRVFLVQHLHILPQGEEDVKIIGVYSSRQAAIEAIERLRSQPGFMENPKQVNPLVDDGKEGFYIDEYPLDKDHWTEGYVTVHPDGEG
jgi:hypothetical protein